MADHQGLGDIQSKLHDLFLRHRMGYKIIRKGCQQFHPDQDVPADLSLMFPDHIILVGNNVGIAHESGHDPDLVPDILHLLGIILLCIFHAQTVSAQLHQLRLTGWYPDHLHCSLFQIAAVLAVDLIYFPETSTSQFPDNFPVRPHLYVLYRHCLPPAVYQPCISLKIILTAKQPEPLSDECLRRTLPSLLKMKPRHRIPSRLFICGFSRSASSGFPPPGAEYCPPSWTDDRPACTGIRRS